MKKIFYIIKSMRVKQWIKNMFIFLPLVFGSRLFVQKDFLNSIAAFFIFCLASSGIYLVNDVKDKKRDAFHPKKRHRPIAAGLLSIKLALSTAAFLLTAALLFSGYMQRGLFFIIFLYIAMHFFYTFRFKREVILDVILIAIGFELRVWGGAVCINVEPSIWLKLCIFVLALFLGFIKRRHERTSLHGKAVKHREVLSYYRAYFLDHIIIISATLCIVFYGLYSVSEDIINKNMAYTIPFVIYGIFRYLYVVHVKRTSGEPSDIITSDFYLILDILLWIGTAIFILYL